MYTGIVKALVEVITVEKKPGLTTFGVELSEESGVEMGASIAIDGVCLTVAKIQDGKVFFDVMEQTLKTTTLEGLRQGQQVNLERSARFGDEVGGHILSGHVYGTAKITKIEEWENNQIDTFSVPCEWMKYILTKGFISLDGVSLTVVDTDKERGTFRVSFIPETLKRTTFGFKEVGDLVNLELDSQTQTIVETVERVLASQSERT